MYAPGFLRIIEILPDPTGIGQNGTAHREVWQCELCGALILDRARHAEFHLQRAAVQSVG